ncbi:MAG: hypothetical protein KC547_06040 [Anaerolineae bacterium]|nr:hypothetical protein [Anaerolineae bacterium]MCA9908646.1 hypothetical protein [Anaerolineae bacterium]
MPNHEIGLNRFQLQVLRMVMKGKGKPKWNWHDIAILVVPVEDEPETSAYKALQRLKELGLVRQITQPYPTLDKWEITELGQRTLKSQADNEHGADH